MLDDLGYVQQSPDEAEVLFTLLTERYKRRSVLVTSNLVFSQWDRIFRDQMATAAAIDPPRTPRGRDRIRHTQLPHGPVAPEIAAPHRLPGGRAPGPPLPRARRRSAS